MRDSDMPDSQRLADKHQLLQVFFERPSEELIKEDRRYRYIIFNHCGFYTPYWGTIFENVGVGLGMSQESSDKYLPKNSVRIITHVNLTKDIYKIFEKNHGNYGNCFTYVARMLLNLGLIETMSEIMGVDDAYFALLKHRLSTEFVKDHIER